MMKKIKRPSKNELVGSVGIAAALYMGALAMHMQESADKAASAATQFQQEYSVSAESGSTGQSNAAKDAYDEARKEQWRRRDGEYAFGALGVIALGLGLDALGKQAKEDSRKRSTAALQSMPETYPADDPTMPIPVYAQPGPAELPAFDETQRISRVTIPVPRSEATGVAKHRTA